MVAKFEQVLEELKTLKEEIIYIKEHMADRDMFLTSQEKQLLEESYESEKQCKTVSSAALLKKLRT